MLVGLEEGLQAFGLPAFVGKTPLVGAYILQLYTNNINGTNVPVSTNVLVNFTQCVDAGYAPVTLTGASWTISQVGGVASATFPQQFITFAGSVTVYGYVAVDSTSTKGVWAEGFGPNGFSFISGQTLQLTPGVTLS